MRLRGTGGRYRRGAGSRVLVAGLAALAVSGLVAGCSGKKDEPSPWPTFSSPPAPLLTPTPGPTPPAKSALAREGTAAGAVEFVKWFLQAYTYAYAYGDPTPIQDTASGSCQFCKGVIDRVKKRKAAGQRVVGERITPAGLAAVPGGTTKHTEVMGFIDVTRSTLVDASGKTLQSFGAARRQLDIAVTWDIVSGWRVVGARITK